MTPKNVRNFAQIQPEMGMKITRRRDKNRRKSNKDSQQLGIKTGKNSQKFCTVRCRDISSARNRNEIRQKTTRNRDTNRLN